MLGVVREQPEHHLQAAPPGAQHCHLRLGVDLVGGQLRRDRAAGLIRRAELAAISRSAAGISLAFLSAAVMAGSASRAARPRSAAARSFSASRTAELPSLRAGLSTILAFSPGAVAVPGEFGAGLRVVGWCGSLPLRGAAGGLGCSAHRGRAGPGSMDAGCL